MNKLELIAAVADKTQCSKMQVEKITNEIFRTVMQTLAMGEEISIVGFGVFEVRERKKRMGVNPRTLEPMMIPERRVAGFRQSQKLKEMLIKE